MSLVSKIPQPHLASRNPSLWFLCLTLWCFSFILNASNLNTNTMQFKRIAMEGSSYIGSVHDIHQDKKGFIWIGGHLGLARYDGYEFKIFTRNAQSSNTLLSNTINDIEEDENGNLWIATERGLNKYEYKSESFTAYGRYDELAQQISYDGILTLHVTSQNQLWLGSRRGLAYFDPNRNVIIDEPLGKYSRTRNVGEYIFDITQNNQGLFYLATAYDLKIWDAHAKQVISFPVPPNNTKKFNSKIVRSVEVDSKNRVWLGTDLGLFKFSPYTHKFVFYPTQFQPNSLEGGFKHPTKIYDIHEDQYKNIWVATDKHGINILDDETNKLISLTHDTKIDHTIMSSSVRVITELNNGDIWLGNSPSGLSVYERYSAAFHTYISKDNDNTKLNRPSVKQILEDDKGNLWLAVERGGLNYFDMKTKTFSYFTHDPNNENSLGSDDPLDIFIDKDNVLWATTWSSAITTLDLKTGQYTRIPAQINKPKQLMSPNTYSVLQDHLGDMWVATMGKGLFKYNKEENTFKRYINKYNVNNTLANSQIWELFMDSRNNIWAGTQIGLSRYNRETDDFTNYLNDPNNPNSISNNEARAIYEDSKGQIWVGTNGGGVNIYNYETDQFKVLTANDGLASNIVQAIIEDDEGIIWISTSNGITRYDTERPSMKNYDKGYGLPGNEFNPNSAHKTQDGKIVFGALNGMTMFDPKALVNNDEIPKLSFTNVTILNKPVDISAKGSLAQSITEAEQIKLDYTQDIVTFEFSALNYRNAYNNQYAYMLEGFDNQWYHVGNKRTATYTKLDPGKYVFRVKAANNEGVWTPKGISINVIVTPPPWKTIWAFALYCSLALAAVTYYLIAQKRTKKYLASTVKRRTLQLEATHKKLKDISITDSLTGLKNRLFVENSIEGDVARIMRLHESWYLKRATGSPENSDIAFYLIDIDHFKQVNDKHGHSAGDTALIEVSKRLKSIVRDIDDVVRWGGEEFLVIARNVDRYKTELLADRLLSVIQSNPVVINDALSLNITISVGLSVLPSPYLYQKDSNWERTVDYADIALYAAKHNGRNAWVSVNAHSQSTVPSSEFIHLLQQGQIDFNTSLGTQLNWK